jgi:D-alanyl-D-alanine carboxypeptidase (penicillin-binding protein 5/6)
VDKLLSIEVAVLLLLVVISIFVRVGVIDSTADVMPDGQLQATQPTLPSDTIPAQPEPSETEPEPTENESTDKLTFGENFTLESRHYFVYDCGGENFMAKSDNADERVYPASVTKIFSAYVALQYLDPDTVITLGREVYMVAPNSSYAGVKVGQKISVRDLVRGMLLPSGNDAAYGLAVAAARTYSGDADMPWDDALDYFSDMMNRTAQANGMTGSHFSNPDGYHDFDHYTTCEDLAVMARLALSNDLIRSCTATVRQQVIFSNGERVSWGNTNDLIDPNSQYYHPDAVGLKTGHTGYAGFCVLSAFELDGEYIIIGSFGCQRPEDRYIDTLKLYELVLEMKNA